MHLMYKDIYNAKFKIQIFVQKNFVARIHLILIICTHIFILIIITINDV